MRKDKIQSFPPRHCVPAGSSTRDFPTRVAGFHSKHLKVDLKRDEKMTHLTLHILFRGLIGQPLVFCKYKFI